MKGMLLGLALLLGVLLAWQWQGWAPPAPPSVGTQPAPGKLPPAPARPTDLAGPTPLEDYATVRQRPLFLPGRRPPPEEPEVVEDAPPTAPSDLAGMQLTAVVIAPQVVSAWVRSPASAELIRLRIGDDLEGWSVTGIEPELLRLERQGETNELKLRNFGNAPPVAPPPQPPPGVPMRQPARMPVAAGQPGAAAPVPRPPPDVAPGSAPIPAARPPGALVPRAPRGGNVRQAPPGVRQAAPVPVPVPPAQSPPPQSPPPSPPGVRAAP